MYRTITGFFFVILFLVYPATGLKGYKGRVHAQEPELTAEELEIIDNMELLDNLDLLKEDLEFFEGYADIDQTEVTVTGEADE